MNLGIFIAGLSIAIALTIGAVVFGPVILDGMHAGQVIADGVTAPARVTELKDTGIRYNYQPYIAVHLEVMPKNRAPFPAVAKRVLTVADAPRFAPGRMLTVKYNPAHPDQIAIVGDGP